MDRLNKKRKKKEKEKDADANDHRTFCEWRLHRKSRRRRQTISFRRSTRMVKLITSHKMMIIMMMMMMRNTLVMMLMMMTPPSSPSLASSASTVDADAASVADAFAGHLLFSAMLSVFSFQADCHGQVLDWSNLKSAPAACTNVLIDAAKAKATSLCFPLAFLPLSHICLLFYWRIESNYLCIYRTITGQHEIMCVDVCLMCEKKIKTNQQPRQSQIHISNSNLIRVKITHTPICLVTQSYKRNWLQRSPIPIPIHRHQVYLCFNLDTPPTSSYTTTGKTSRNGEN